MGILDDVGQQRLGLGLLNGTNPATPMPTAAQPAPFGFAPLAHAAPQAPSPDDGIEHAISRFLSRLSSVNAARGMVGGAEDAVRNLPTNFVEGARDLATLPQRAIDASQRSIDNWAIRPIRRTSGPPWKRR